MYLPIFRQSSLHISSSLRDVVFASSELAKERDVQLSGVLEEGGGFLPENKIFALCPARVRRGEGGEVGSATRVGSRNFGKRVRSIERSNWGGVEAMKRYETDLFRIFFNFYYCQFSIGRPDGERVRILLPLHKSTSALRCIVD